MLRNSAILFVTFTKNAPRKCKDRSRSLHTSVLVALQIPKTLVFSVDFTDSHFYDTFELTIIFESRPTFTAIAIFVVSTDDFQFQSWPFFRQSVFSRTATLDNTLCNG